MRPREARFRKTDGLYTNWLGRRSDPGGLEHWAEELRTRGFIAVEAAFVTSDEAHRMLGG